MNFEQSSDETIVQVTFAVLQKEININGYDNKQKIKKYVDTITIFGADYLGKEDNEELAIIKNKLKQIDEEKKESEKKPKIKDQEEKKNQQQKIKKIKKENKKDVKKGNLKTVDLDENERNYLLTMLEAPRNNANQNDMNNANQNVMNNAMNNIIMNDHNSINHSSENENMNESFIQSHHQNQNKK